MTIAPIIVIISTTVAIGGYMGFQYLMGVRNRPMLIAIHLLLGAGGLEVMAMLLRGAPDGSHIMRHDLGEIAAIFMVGALMTGLIVPLLAQPAPRRIGPLLLVHAGVALIAYGALVYWAFQL